MFSREPRNVLQLTNRCDLRRKLERLLRSRGIKLLFRVDVKNRLPTGFISSRVYYKWIGHVLPVETSPNMIPFGEFSVERNLVL